MTTGRDSRGRPDGLARLLRTWRKRALLTQEQLADRAGVSVGTVRGVEAGRIRQPHNHSLRLLADGLGLTADERAAFAATARGGTPHHVPAPRAETATAASAKATRTTAAAATQAAAEIAAHADNPRVVPAQLPPDVFGFTGRQGELSRLDRLLSEATRQQAMPIVAITGTAGVGKTTLAVHWAHHVADRFPDGQLYLNLRGFDPAGAPVPAPEAVRRLLDGLNVAPQRIPADAASQIGLYRSVLANKRVLVVLDNARDADQVRPLLPGAAGCLALVTSRNRLTGLVAVDSAHPLTLDVLSQAEARHLLTGRLGNDRVAAEPAATDALIQLCARLPLAIAVAAGHAATQPGLPLTTLADNLRTTRGRLDGLTGDDTATDIRSVFACSYQALSPAGARLFRLLGLHPGPDISAAAAASLAGVPPAEVKPLLAELARAHLIGEPAYGRFTFHDLLRAYASEQADRHEPDSERRAALHRVLDHYLHTAYAADLLISPHRDYRYPITLDPAQPGVTVEELTDPGQALRWFAAEHPVLLAAIDHAAGTGLDTHAWQLAWTFAIFLDRQGGKNDLANTQQVALHAAERLGDRAAQAVAHLLLGRAKTYIAHLDEARAELQRALELYHEVGDQTGQARTHIVLCLLLVRHGRFQEALDHGQQALDLYRVTGMRAGEPGSLSIIAWCHNHLGYHDQAIAEGREAIALSRELGDQRGESWAWTNLGIAHRHLGNHDQAIAANQHAIDLFRELGDRYNEADTLVHLGDIHHSTGDAMAARTAWQQALIIFDQLDHPDAATVHSRLSGLDPDDAPAPGRPTAHRQ